MEFINRIISGGKEIRNAYGRQILFFFVLFSFFLILDFRGVTEIIVEIYKVRGGWIPLGFYLFTWIGVVFSLLVLYTNRSRLVRFASYALSAVSLAGFMGFKFLNGRGYGYNEAVLTVNEYTFIREAIGEYFWIAFLGAAFSLFFVGCLVYFCKIILPDTRRRYLLIAVFFFGCMGYIINRHADLVLEHFPAAVNVPAITYYASLNTLYFGPRSQPRFDPENDGAADHLVLIMDESVRGDHLSINGSEQDTTPYLKNPGLELINLGIACSAGNQSASSNIIVQSGLALNQVPDTENAALKMPSVFQYAKNCGRKTFFINAQGTQLSDYMTKHDLNDIDSYTFIGSEYPESKRWEYDHIAADLIRSILEKEQKTFIYILKNGAHYPYGDMYPETEQIFEPVDVSGAEQIIFIKDSGGRVNSYDNAVRWSVNGFFAKLLPHLEESSCLFAYVSDHGQSLDSGEGRVIVTHSTIDDPPVDQANTPMFILLGETAENNLGSGMISSMLENKNRLSHFQVFPTMLYFMGYAKDEITREYGPTIVDPVPDDRYFVSGDIFGRSVCRKNLFVH